MKQVTFKQAKKFKRTSAMAAVALTLTGAGIQATAPAFADDQATASTDKTKTSENTPKGLKVTPDATDLNTAVKNAEAAGVKVTTADTKTTTVAAKDAGTNKTRIDDSYATKVNDLNDLATKQKTADAQYAKDEATYKTALAAYNKAVKGQTNDANPSNPLQPEQLAYEQPFDLTANKNGLSKVSVTSTKISDKSQVPAGDLYNSDYIRRIKVSDTTKPITITYKNVAKDKESGKSLDVTLTLSDFVTDKIDTQGSSADANPYIYVYSNYADSVSQFNVVAMKQSTTYTYSDSGKSYDKDYYQTYGSLNYQDNNRYEFTAPDSGVKATFLNKGTAIANKLQKVSGKAANNVSEAFMGVAGTNQPADAWDTRPQALTELGVTYLVNNGASVWLGVSGGDGKDPVAKPGDGGYWATYNHIMMGANTVAPTATKPVAPKKPTPLKADFQLENLLVTPEVTKDVDAGTNKGNAKGSADGQTFMVGDKMTYSLTASALPAGRDAYKSIAFADTLPDGFKYTGAKAFDKDGKDISDQFKFTEKDGKLTAAYTDEAVKAVNAAKNKETDVPTIVVYGEAAKNGVTLSNAYQFVVDGTPFDSNKVNTPVKDIEAHKDVEAGAKDTVTGESVNGKAVVKGQELTYDLTADDLPANRATDVKSLDWTDPLPSYVDYVGYKVVNAAGEDVTSQYDYKGDGKHKFALEAKSTVALNADKTTATKLDKVLIYVKANQDGVNFKNTATLRLNDKDKKTNTVENRTPNYKPVKKDVDGSGKNVDGQNVKPGDKMRYEVVGNLSDMTDMAFSKDAFKSDAFVLADDYDETRLDVTDQTKKDFTIDLVKPEASKTTLEAKASSTSGSSSSTSDFSTTSASTKASTASDKKASTESGASSESTATAQSTSASTIDGTTSAGQTATTDATTKANGDTVYISKGTATKFDMNDVNVTWDLQKGKWTATPKNPLEFYQKYAGYDLVAHFDPTVKKGATGVIKNVASQTIFGNDKKTNEVKNPITPTKEVKKAQPTKAVQPAKPVEKTETPAQKAKQLPNTGSHGPIQQIVDFFQQVFK